MKTLHRPDFRGLLFLGAAAFSAECAQGAILSRWDFDGVNRSPSDVAAGLTAGDFGTPGSFSGTTGPISSATVQGQGGSDPYVFGANGLSTGESAAITDNDFYTFTLTPTVGNQASFSSISFYAWANTNFNAESYTFFVRNDLTGATTLGSFTNDLEFSNGTAPSSGSEFVLDLTGVAALQNVTSGTTFSIGVYVTNPPDTGFQGNLRIDSIQLDGTVSVIPEPSALALAGLGAVAVLRRRRR